MSDSVSLSSSMRSNLLALQNTSLLTDMTQSHLATGKKVNSALDNPTSFFTAAALNNRASDLSSRLDSIGQGAQTLKAADQSLTALTKLVEQAKALATQASEAATSAVSLSSLQAKHATAFSNASTSASVSITLSIAWAGINTGAAPAKLFQVVVNGGTARTISLDAATASVGQLISTLNTALASDGVTATWNATSSKIEFNARENTTIEIDEGVGNAAATIFGGGNVGAANKQTIGTPVSTDLVTQAFDGLVAGEIFSLTVTDTAGSASTLSITISTTTDISALMTLLNTASAGNFTASFNGTTNKIEFTGTAGYKVEINDGATGGAASELFGSSKVGATNAITFGSAAGSATVQKNLTDFKTVMDQIDQLVSDASYKGKNLLKGTDTLTVLFNEDGSSKLDISGVNFTHDSGLGFTSTATLAWGSTTAIQSSIDQAKVALDSIRSQAAKFGTANSIVSTRQDFTKSMVDTLKGGADKLVLADMNEEAANMLALQTQRSLATNSLSMASQAAQSVLQLFR